MSGDPGDGFHFGGRKKLCRPIPLPLKGKGRVSPFRWPRGHFQSKDLNKSIPVGRLLLGLATKGARYRYLKYTGLMCRPEALSLEITRRCIARCIMCNIWRTPRYIPDLAISDWIQLVSSPIFSELKELDITGGEPFLREDLSVLLERVCHIKGRHFRGLKSIAITTNGFLTHKILKVIRTTAPLMEAEGIDLVIACAMDARGELHDRIRNFKDGWKRLHETIQGLKEIREVYGKLIIGIKTTIVPLNVDALDDIAEYAEQNGLFIIISPCIITANRYANMDREKELRFSQEDLQKIIRFYEGPRFQWSYHRKALIDFLHKGRIKKPCSAGFNYFFIRSSGEVFPCPIIPFKLGNFKEVPIEEILGSSTAKRFRRRVGRFPECRSCTEPGLERYALPFEGFRYLGLFFKMGREAFLNLHRHMGLDKYF